MQLAAHGNSLPRQHNDSTVMLAVAKNPCMQTLEVGSVLRKDNPLLHGRPLKLCQIRESTSVIFLHRRHINAVPPERGDETAIHAIFIDIQPNLTHYMSSRPQPFG